jgi:3',5'-cyclic AMP phosphodiesterase CpdA
MNVKKIIHLSDLHIGYRDMGERFQCITDNIIFEKEPASEYVILITGDLVEKATDSSSYEETRLYIQKLEAAGFTVLVVPGNHDYGTGSLGSKKYVRLFKEVFFGDPEIQYPKLDIIEGIAFVGLDSMAEELNWYDRLFAEGELGGAQRRRLDALLSDAAVKACAYRVVYLHHHPFDPYPLHQLKDSEALGEILVKHGNVDALLYGHNHLGKKHNGKWGIPRCYDAGTTTRKLYGTGHHRVVDLSRDARLDYDADFHCVY